MDPEDPAGLEIERQRFMTLDRCLDRGEGPCPLRHPSAAGALAAFLRKGYQRWLFPVWVIMPNHVHLLARPTGKDRALKPFLRQLKGRTAHDLNRLLGRSGPFWQRDSFDRWIRSARHLNACRRYILNNPTKAGLGDDYRWVDGGNDREWRALVERFDQE
ncbi:MAG: transposase [Opitutales bacterium]